MAGNHYGSAIAALHKRCERIHAQLAGMAAKRMAAVAILEDDGLNPILKGRFRVRGENSAHAPPASKPSMSTLKNSTPRETARQNESHRQNSSRRRTATRLQKFRVQAGRKWLLGGKATGLQLREQSTLIRSMGLTGIVCQYGARAPNRYDRANAPRRTAKTCGIGSNLLLYSQHEPTRCKSFTRIFGFVGRVDRLHPDLRRPKHRSSISRSLRTNCTSLRERPTARVTSGMWRSMSRAKA